MRVVKWLAIGVAGVIGGIAVLLAASIVIAGFAGGDRVGRLSNEVIPGAGGPAVRAFVAEPAGPGPYPAVILIHEFWGLTPDLVAKAELLAAEGYLVVAPDLFRGSSTDWIPRAIFQVITTGQPQLTTDLNAVFQWLTDQPNVTRDRVAVGGFCFGGRTALLYALTNPRIASTVVFYGSPVTDPTQLAALTGPVLGIFGGADASIPLEEVRGFQAGLAQAGVPAEISIYPGQPHAFVDTAGIQAGGPASEAWLQMLTFLDASLRSPRTASAAPAPATSSATPQPSPHSLAYLLSLAVLHGTAAHSPASGHH